MEWTPVEALRPLLVGLPCLAQRPLARNGHDRVQGRTVRFETVEEVPGQVSQEVIGSIAK